MSKHHYIGILDYGSGNTYSLNQSLKKMGYRSYLLSDASAFDKASAVMIPGVGAFPEAMSHLEKKQLIEPIKAFQQSGKPLIGICLGMQLLADTSYELGETQGLGLIPGQVSAIGDPAWHIGWNRVTCQDTDNAMHQNTYYFNHSYHFVTEAAYVTGWVDVGQKITASVQKENVIGFQFHPEKSQLSGFELLDSLLKGVLYAG